MVFACGPKPKPTNFVLKISANVSGVSTGGILLLGRNKTNGASFQESIKSLNFSKELSKGEWQFVAFSWSGLTDFGGTLNCSEIINKSIEVSSEVVDLIVNESKCINISNYFDPGGVDAFSNPNVPYHLQLRLCDPTESQVSLDSGFCSYSGLATGVRLSAATTRNLKLIGFPLQSNCLKLSSGSHFSSMKIPMLPQIFKDPFWKVDIFYSSAGGACLGSSCCEGRRETVNFRNGLKADSSKTGELSSYYANFSNTFSFTEPSVPDELRFNGITSVSYNNCNPVQVDYYSQGTPIAAPNSFNFTPACSTNCSFYTDASCTLPASQITFPSGSASHTFYMEVNSGESFTLSQGGDDFSIAGDQASGIIVSASYADIDANFVNNAANLGSYGTTSLNLGNIAAGVWVVYQTRNGNRGKMFINNRYQVTTPDDTIDFDFITWNGVGGVVASGTGITSTQCFSSGDCWLDLDINAGKLSPSNVPGESEAWWGGNGGVSQFSPQAGVPFRLMGP